MCGTTARVARKTPRRFTLMTASNVASSMTEATAPSFHFTSWASRRMPALLTSTSMRPCFLIVSPTAFSIDSRCVTSTGGVSPTAPRVANSHSYASIAARKAHGHVAALRSELHSIRKEIPADLLDAQRIALHDARVSRKRHVQRNVLAVRLRTDHRDGLPDDRRHRDRR